MHIKDYHGQYTKEEVIEKAQAKLGPLWEMKNGGPTDLYFVRKGFSSGVMLAETAPDRGVMAVKYIRLNFSRENRLRVSIGTNLWAWPLYFLLVVFILSLMFPYGGNFPAYGKIYIGVWIAGAYYFTRQAVIRIVDNILY